ncbi:MAG: ATP-dependent Clp protease ATP-binding subunit [Bacteroidales bacterium]|nr:ATP-dependent Clp protease ATP-binding subunit [Bacteroidales bacterium]
MDPAQTLKLSDELKNAFHVAQSLAQEHMHEKFTPAHLLKGVLHKESGIIETLKAWDVDVYYLDDWAEVRLEDTPKASKLPSVIQGDENVDKVVYEAENLCVKVGKDDLDPMAIFAAICLPGVGFSYDQLKTLPVKGQDIVDKLQDGADQIVSPNLASGSKEGKVPGADAALFNYCTDMVEVARQQDYDAVIGREPELMSMAEIICRRKKANVIITGDSGVGKTALVHGLAIALANQRVPKQLENAVLFELNFSDLMSGATYRGEMEDRFKKILTDLRQFQKSIVFIDDIHILLDKNSGNQGLINLLVSELSKGGFTLLGATNRDDYRKYIDNDANLKRRCEQLDIDEPNAENALPMIESALTNYSEHHAIKISREVIEETVQLSKRYIKERRLPDAAIDVIDRTMAALRIMLDTTPLQIDNFVEKINNLPSDEEEKAHAFQNLITEISTAANGLIFNLADSGVLDKIKEEGTTNTATLTQWLDELKESVSKHKEEIEVADIASILARSTGIPAGKLMSSEQERLLTMEDNLKEKVIGQDLAVKTVTESILESRSGLTKSGQPIGSFFLLGPTGTGKTELAKRLAEYLFQDSAAMIRFDMSEFKEEHSAALLYGAPPGYVGYEEGGMLVNKIRQQPYSVVLFDEIEKAHNSVFDIFLQILDEGKLHDRLGKEGDFSNAVVLFTSNIGSQFVVEKFNKEGILPESNTMMEIMSNHFRPEFLGRLTGIVPFAPITKENITKIFALQFKELEKLLENQKISVEISDEAQEFLAYEGFNPEYGARPLRAVIRSRLRTPLSRKIISGEIKENNHIKIIKTKDDEITFEIS